VRSVGARAGLGGESIVRDGDESKGLARMGDAVLTAGRVTRADRNGGLVGNPCNDDRRVPL